jgi:hypothetical protein
MSPQHLSIRVPWRDQPWDGRVCTSPLDNGACLLLSNIGEKRDDVYERTVAGKPVNAVDQDRLPCLSERGTFMSADGYRVVKVHPYSHNRALKGHLEPTVLAVPGYSFEAVPFRWLSRSSFEQELQEECPEYDPELEDRARSLMAFQGSWLMDARNQRAVIDRFFRYVERELSLVFIYLKHSPLQEGSTRRLLVGAARITDLRPPQMWRQSGGQPFDSSMWETLVHHSLRSDQRDGVLLPYQELVRLMDDGADIGPALAWGPEGRDQEFSYVTEHVSDDGAIAALTSLREAADGARGLGLKVPYCAVGWLDQQIERLWQLRGPAPGLPAVLSCMGVQNSHRVARTILAATPEDGDPWPVVDQAMDPTTDLGRSLAADLPHSIRVTWRGLPPDRRRILVVLAAMDLTAAQVQMLLDGDTSLPLDAAELVANPYYAAICTYRIPDHVAFSTIDRACFPAPHVRWPNVMASVADLDDPGDRRRIEALMVEVLERLAAEGDTIAAASDVIRQARDIPLDRPCPVTEDLVTAQGLDAATLAGTEDWTPVVGAELADGLPAYKLLHLAVAKDTINEHLRGRRAGGRFSPDFDARRVIDDMLSGSPGPGPSHSAEEDLARTEKAAGLAELYASRLSVLVGPAGTGKTTLLRALVAQPDIRADGVLLLAPTGKARVQLETKVGHRAETLASYLIKRQGYDPDSGRYLEVPQAHKTDVGLVVVDEASMLTEEMLAAVLSSLGRVTRLILVGDHRQLPPIGAGRPFVDLVEWLRPPAFDLPPRVAPGYVELTVFRRQQESGSGSREDLALAAWFGGGDLPGAADDVWQGLRAGDETSTVRYCTWEGHDLLTTLDGVLRTRLGLLDAADPEKAFTLSYGGRLTDDGRYVNWPTGKAGAGDSCEKWQILCPTRSRVFGTVELNRHLKRAFRQKDLDWAHRRYGYRPPKPLGPEQIVYGDKVMQTRNDSRAKAYPTGAGGLDYIANGEIGVVVGRTAEKPAWVNVEFSSQVGVTYGYKPSPSDDPPLELAWAVTVHKSQGSEFGTTFLVLPRRVRMSRELLYTALTRQTEQVVILHEGTIDDLVALASPANSETARRMTDLFRPAEPREITFADGLRRFDGNLIHVAPNDILVRSKNEVIIATILEQTARGRWSYEKPVTGTDGAVKYPDFTVDLLSGDQVIWEHLGLMTNPTYAAAWEAKKRWYVGQGFRPYDEPDTPGPRGTLVWTDDRDGVDQPAWTRLAEQVLSPPSAGGIRRTAKKATARRTPRPSM